MVSFIKPSAAANMKQYLMPSYGEIMKHALTCKAIGAEVCSSVWCEFVLVKVNMNQLGVILYLNMYVCKFEPIQHVFRQKAFCKESILFHSYTLFYSLQRGQGIFIAINYTHVFSGDPKFLLINGEYYLDVDGTKVLLLSTKRFIRKDYEVPLRNGIKGVTVDRYNDTTFVATFNKEIPNSKGQYTVKFIYYNNSYDIIGIMDLPVMENFVITKRSCSVRNKKSYANGKNRVLLPTNGSVASYEVSKNADSIIVYEKYISARYDTKYKFIYKNGEYYWDTGSDEEIIAMSTKKEMDEEYCLPRMATPYRVTIKSSKDTGYVTSIYIVRFNEILNLRLYYDVSYNINRIQRESCIGYALKPDMFNL